MKFWQSKQQTNNNFCSNPPKFGKTSIDLHLRFKNLFLAYLPLQSNSYRLQMMARIPSMKTCTFRCRFYKKTQTAELSKYCWKKQQRASSRQVKIFALEIINRSAHLLRIFLCQWTLYFFATSFTHLVFISVVKFLHSCIGASGPDPFYAGHKHNIYDPKFSVNKCYISGQKMRETFFTSSSTFVLFHS